jgi:glycosyltransferase involved in cell wall biosynthesis
LFHPAPIAPWGAPERHALACGKPVVASENLFSDALFGPAAYLAPAGDARALGAALITVVVEDSVAENLSQAARQRAESWLDQGFGQKLYEAYLLLLERKS